MKKNRFLWLFLFLLAGSTGVYLFSCQRDAEQTAPKPLSDTPVTSRACPSGYCSFFVTPADDADFTFCGKINNPTGGCSNGCDPFNDGYIDVQISANNTYEVCVDPDGSVCIQNAQVEPDIDVIVQFGSSTPISTTIPGGGQLCFYTNGDCTITRAGCQ